MNPTKFRTRLQALLVDYGIQATLNYNESSGLRGLYVHYGRNQCVHVWYGSDVDSPDDIAQAIAEYIRNKDGQHE